MITKRVNTISDTAHSQTAHHPDTSARAQSTTSIDFTKMHGLGNDFVIIDTITQAVSLTSQQIRQIADRHFGIGCDQVLLVEQPHSPSSDFRYRIFNADGGEVEQCGNGARCFAAFVRDRGLTHKDALTVETATGIIHIQVRADGDVSVDMGIPRLNPKDIPFTAERQATNYPLNVGDLTLTIGAVSMGNPHAVLRVDDINSAPVATLGPQIEHHPRFPKRVNTGFVQIINRGHIRLRVFERGVGETLACGTGACAAVVSGNVQGLLDQEVTVDLPGGRLLVNWAGGNAPVIMTGPTARVFEGKIEV